MAECRSPPFIYDILRSRQPLLVRLPFPALDAALSVFAVTTFPAFAMPYPAMASDLPQPAAVPLYEILRRRQLLL